MKTSVGLLLAPAYSPITLLEQQSGLSTLANYRWNACALFRANTSLPPEQAPLLQ